jgi:hypothetical protein
MLAGLCHNCGGRGTSGHNGAVLSSGLLKQLYAAMARYGAGHLRADRCHCRPMDVPGTAYGRHGSGVIRVLTALHTGVNVLQISGSH